MQSKVYTGLTTRESLSTIKLSYALISRIYILSLILSSTPLFRYRFTTKTHYIWSRLSAFVNLSKTTDLYNTSNFRTIILIYVQNVDNRYDTITIKKTALDAESSLVFLFTACRHYFLHS